MPKIIIIFLNRSPSPIYRREILVQTQLPSIKTENVNMIKDKIQRKAPSSDVIKKKNNIYLIFFK